MPVDKKPTTQNNTAAVIDGYWLACIAQRQAPAALSATHATLKSISAEPAMAAAEAPVAKHFPRSPADSFWLKHAEAHHQIKAGGDPALGNTGATQGAARVSMPEDIVYTAIVDDGQTHHPAWSVRNISLTGVLLDMDVSHLHEGVIVDFLLRYNRGRRAFDSRIPAKVVRIQLNSLALQFNYLDSVTYQDLARLLYSL